MALKPLDPIEETEAFVETVKLLAEFHGEPDLKEIAVFFPDALLVRDEDCRSESFTFLGNTSVRSISPRGI
jgi:hypothetical protein